MSESSVASSTFSRASAHALSFSSASSASSPFSGASRVDHNGFLSSSHRAGGPVLASLPALTTENTFTDSAVLIHARAEIILDNLELEYSVVILKGRISKVDPEPGPIPTLIVLMPDVLQPVLWYEAAKKIHRELEPHIPRISVEIIEEKLYDGIYCFPVEQTHSIYRKWRTIAETILMNRSLNIQEWTSIECWRYGTNPDRRLNPVTIIVEVDRRSTESFITASQIIRGMLAYYQESSVDILFMKDGKQSLMENPILNSETCSGAVYPGVSIGIHGSSAGTSTLGGIIQLRLPNESEWRTYGLTCFHAVWPPEGKRSQQMLQRGANTALAYWEYNPLKLKPSSDIAQQVLKVDHPSFRDIQHTLTIIDSDINSSKTEEFLDFEATQKAIDKGEDLWIPESAARRYRSIARHIRSLEATRQPFAAMLDNGTYYLGYVAAGSGLYRIQQNDLGQPISMDWALIKITSGRIQAQLNGDEIDGNRPFHSGAANFTPPAEFIFNPGLQVYSRMKLYKTGRSTGTTYAYYNGLVSVDICLQKTAHGVQKVFTWEHTVTEPISHAFAEPGDSGSWVYTPAGEVFGVLHSRDMRKGTMRIASIVDIFKDIKRLTGAAEVRIAPCPI
ncbi:uncharacterized protein N7518_006633 [Penicillium psychrosexuale]|uniref:uncharacterized protein n=1 Tax=Penicillium psychrosexuale TaxID=1002107 RepID=UPI002544EAD6|nr:uncharacterized protein N7518_006633 [Penicillium psychrosexuale]KAJ5789622.1 hypothetical protein N7518_006633 [Penicillium psychrosexuale]